MKRKYSIEERRSKILNMLHTEGRVFVGQLVDAFGVSEVSIRKDLAVLEERKLLVRVKGGAIALHQPGDLDDMSISSKQQLHTREKQLIGKYAASMIGDGERIIIDSGTTTMEIAKNLDAFKDLTIITNALDIAITLNNYGRFTVIDRSPLPYYVKRTEWLSADGSKVMRVLYNASDVAVADCCGVALGPDELRYDIFDSENYCK